MTWLATYRVGASAPLFENQIDVEIVRHGVQNDRLRADEPLMQTNRHRTVVAAVALVVVVALGAAACGEEADGSGESGAISADPTVTTASSADETEEAQGIEHVGAEEASTTLAEIDESADRFESAVGRDYVVTFELVSSVSAEAGPVRVEVADGSATQVSYPDAMTEQVLPQLPLLTVSDFFARARAVLADGGLVEIEFDEAYGHPLTMTLDPIPDAIDDELSIVVRSVEPMESSVDPDGY